MYMNLHEENFLHTIDAVGNCLSNPSDSRLLFDLIGLMKTHLGARWHLALRNLNERIYADEDTGNGGFGPEIPAEAG